MVAYSNRILDIADECVLNDIIQQEIMAMVFIIHCRSHSSGRNYDAMASK